MTDKTKQEDMLIDESMQLLNTIKIPVNLHYLTDRLPEANYNPLSTRRSFNGDYSQDLKPLKNIRIKHKRSKSNVVDNRGKQHFPNIPNRKYFQEKPRCQKKFTISREERD